MFSKLAGQENIEHMCPLLASTESDIIILSALWMGEENLGGPSQCDTDIDVYFGPIMRFDLLPGKCTR